MKLAVFTVVGILLSMHLHAQENLVPNGSFEETLTCPDNNGNLMHSYSKYWISPGIGSPDLFHGCGLFEHQVPPSVVYGNQLPKSDQGFIGMYFFSHTQPEGREYAQVKLREPMHYGIRYKVSFYVSLSELSRYAVSSLGAHLSKEPLTQSTYWVIDAEPQIQNPAGNIIADTSGWVLVTDTFKTRAGGGEEWLTIGNFNYAVDSDTLAFQPANPDMGGFFHSYYYIDDVSVVALDSIPNSVTELEKEDDDFLVYPNPTNGLMKLNYKLEEVDQATLSIYTYAGALVQERALNNERLSIDIDLTNVETGLYILKVDVNGAVKLSERISVVTP